MKDKLGGFEDCFDSFVVNEIFIVEIEMKKRIRCFYLFNVIIVVKFCLFFVWFVFKYC